MLDGIRLSSEQTAAFTLGIDSGSRNHVLDFTLGNSENLKVSRKLLSHLVAHGFSCERRLDSVPVGSDALRAAVKEFFAEAIGRRCLVHKERDITGKLSNRHCGELSRLLMQLQSIQGISAADDYPVGSKYSAEQQASRKPGFQAMVIDETQNRPDKGGVPACSIAGQKFLTTWPNVNLFNSAAVAIRTDAARLKLLVVLGTVAARTQFWIVLLTPVERRI
ncbi:MAG: hypothetical protein GY880_22105 [Planctomycetaceae bacterium]|nr:hypothetical protein [Planctomycetaceae bacterium]